jgi:hypothetical protein
MTHNASFSLLTNIRIKEAFKKVLREFDLFLLTFVNYIKVS